MTDYSNYRAFLRGICDSGDLSGFKSSDEYRGILEHISSEYGADYIEYIKEYTDITDNMIREFCALNDSIGSPITTDYDFVTASPSNMRYIFHSHIILKHLQSLNIPKVDIVEVGGGYGGLCLAMHYLSKSYDIKIDSYTIVDLKEASDLQRIYLSRLIPGIEVDCVDACTFGKHIDKSGMFLISNYCFSEISGEYQKEYITHLFPKVSHGFMAWNYIETYDFGFKIRIEEERPHTGGKYNKYLYF
jgi:hypothetical protein